MTLGATSSEFQKKQFSSSILSLTVRLWPSENVDTPQPHVPLSHKSCSIRIGTGAELIDVAIRPGAGTRNTQRALSQSNQSRTRAVS
jgi:hypothetical protein